MQNWSPKPSWSYCRSEMGSSPILVQKSTLIMLHVHQEGMKRLITPMRFPGDVTVGSQGGPEKLLESVGRGSCFRALWWLQNGAGMSFPHTWSWTVGCMAWMSHLGKGERTQVFLSACPDLGWKGRGTGWGLKTVTVKHQNGVRLYYTSEVDTPKRTTLECLNPNSESVKENANASCHWLKF